MILEFGCEGCGGATCGAKAKLLKAEDDLRSANAGGKIDEAARVAGDLAKAEARRDGYRRTMMCCSGWSRGKRRRRMSLRRTTFP